MIRGNGMLNRLSEAAVPSGEPILLQPLLELCGDRRILIEHHLGICDYSSEQITVKVKYGHLRICGSTLEVCKMTSEQLVITGCIGIITVIRGSL